MEEHKVSSRYKEKHSETVSGKIKSVCVKVQELMERCSCSRVLHKSVHRTLQQRGIESGQEWDEHLTTIGTDGEFSPTS